MKRKKNSDLKLAALGQALMQSARPNSILSPIQLGLGVAVHHMSGSRKIVDLLHKVGYSLSYEEIKLFELNAAVYQGTDLAGVNDDSWIQFVGDNVDHQIRTIDGNGTFHAMGVIGAATPGSDFRRPIPRAKNITLETLKEVNRIHIKHYASSNLEMIVRFKVLNEFDFHDDSKSLDDMWKISWPLKFPRPGWSG